MEFYECHISLFLLLYLAITG